MTSHALQHGNAERLLRRGVGQHARECTRTLRTGSLRAALFLALLAPLLGGCYKWSAVPDPVPAINEAGPRATFRFVLQRGDTAWLRGPSFRGDSVVGLSLQEARVPRPGILWRDVIEVRRQRFDGVGSFIGIGLLGVVGFIGGAAASFGG